MQIIKIPCKLNKMSEGKLTTLNDAGICDIGTKTASTITARYHKGIGANRDNKVMEVKNLGNIYGFTGGSYAGIVYDSNGLCPNINAMEGGNRQPMIVQEPKLQVVDIPQTVKVRVYEVDIKKLQDSLRGQKRKLSLTNNDIADKLDIPLTQVGHYFRTDKYFTIPEPNVWPQLSKLLEIEDSDLDKQIMTFEEKEGVFEKSERHYLDNGLAPTVLSGSNDKIIVAMRGRNPDNPLDRRAGIPTEQRLEPQQEGICNSLTTVNKDNLVLEPKLIGNIYESEGQAGNVYDPEGYAPCIPGFGGGGGGKEMKIVETVQKPISTKGQEIDVASTILSGYHRTNMTGFNADNGVMVKAVDEQNMNIRHDTFGTIMTDGSSPKKNNRVLIKQATKEGYIDCKIGGVADLSFPDSKTRRGRVQNGGDTSPALTAGEGGICKIESVSYTRKGGVKNTEISPCLQSGYFKGFSNNNPYPGVTNQYRIRKLTPLECWRLMAFTDEEFKKAEAVNSNTQLYKQAGNSIVVDVLVGIFKNIFESLEEEEMKQIRTTYEFETDKMIDLSALQEKEPELFEELAADYPCEDGRYIYDVKVG